MTAIAWDEVGTRRYEAGVDRGVIYLIDGSAVPWNGLVSVDEDTSREVKPFFLDGHKFLAAHILGPYSAKLKAFTYPDELDDVLGTAWISPGVRLHDQPAKTFTLSYRTKVGNDTEGLEHGYKLHVIWNILAVPSSNSNETIGATVEPEVFEWDLEATATRHAAGTLGTFRPISHVSFDSRTMDPTYLAAVEAQIYGTEETAPAMLCQDDLIWLAMTGDGPGGG
jgi:hypothetical protein